MIEYAPLAMARCVFAGLRDLVFHREMVAPKQALLMELEASSDDCEEVNALAKPGAQACRIDCRHEIGNDSRTGD